MTEGTWNLQLIAVHPTRQRQGRGAQLLRHLEQTLAARGVRVLLVDTLGTPDFEHVRAFYRKHGFDEEARIREFYAAGADKVVFRRALAKKHFPNADQIVLVQDNLKTHAAASIIRSNTLPPAPPGAISSMTIRR